MVSRAVKAAATQISAEELFAPVSEGGMNYRKAFLRPPYPNGYTDEDFDEGHEWWGTLCLTVLDRTLDRIVVIMASATD
ncbi:MAG: hypothetical protein IKX67_04225 [Bacteroidales bacterium]|nr:hypothetical protein [Bacteroidales bacterium]